MGYGEVDQLIIIGNGFDLHLGAKTKFKDYINHSTCGIVSDFSFLNKSEKRSVNPVKSLKWINKELDMDEAKVYELSQEGTSWWNNYFNFIKPENEEDDYEWCDVEKQIEFLVRSEAKNHFLANELISYIRSNSNNKSSQKILDREIVPESIYNDVINRINQEKVKKLVCYLKYRYDKFIDPIINIFANSTCILKENDRISVQLEDYLYQTDISKEIRKGIESLVMRLLFIELRIFEYDFTRYLIDNVFPKYDSEKAERLLDEIAEHDTYNLLSFNYIFFPEEASPKEDSKISYDFRELKKCNRHNNVHGVIQGYDSKTVIGFDEKNIVEAETVDEDNKFLYRFTKTYRILDSDLANGKLSNYCLQPNINKIKFYGHSLSEADYSYFLSIFDYYDVYNSDIELIFYFSITASEENKITFYKDQTSIKENVIRLMKKYGDSMSNKSHGRNLLHKLLLEGRLKIKQIKQ